MTQTIVAVFLSFFGAAAAIGCIGQNQEPVDWFVAYKLPKLHDNPRESVRSGVAFLYLDAANPTWRMSNVPVSNSSQAIGYTLNQIYNPKNGDVAYLMFNDETPVGEKYDEKAHQKGVVAFDDKEGFWLVHSTPKFPPQKQDGYCYPHSGHVYGQTFLCISLSGSYFNTIAKQLLISEPSVYDNNIPPSSRYASDDDIKRLVDGEHSDTLTNVSSLMSNGQQEFISFSKSRPWGQDLYGALLAPYFRTSFYVETWQHGTRDNMPSNCTVSDLEVKNVKALSLPFSISFKETKDHAKWAVTISGDKKLICIGDINRQYSQKKRGGGTVCTNHGALWKAFHDAVDQPEECPNHPRKIHRKSEKDQRLKFKAGQMDGDSFEVL